MAEHIATIRWQRAPEEAFTDNRYSRAHEWLFDGGAVVPASPSPDIVKPPYSEPANVDPEEAFVASLSSCHMLFFLSFAGRDGIVVDEYRDEAVGTMARNAAGKSAITRVVLRPALRVSSAPPPDLAKIEALHHEAHDACFIANSVTTEVVVQVGSPIDPTSERTRSN